MEKYLQHRNEIIVRRTKYDLSEAEKRAHILEGYIIALDNIDAVIELIKKSRDVESAKNGLMKKFKLSEIQAKAILDMRLQRLTGLERKKIEEEYKELIKLINKLKAILANKELQLEIIKNELLELKKSYSDERRTEIVYDSKDFDIEDMIADEDVVVTISHEGFIKRFPVSGYRRQNRGGKGVTGATTKEDDFIEHMFIASTHNFLLLFTDKGKCYWLKVHEIPEAGRMSKGRSLSNLIKKATDEKISTFLNVKEFDDAHFIMMVTKEGNIKKTLLSEFSNPRSTGIIAIGLNPKDKLIDAHITDGSQDIIIGSKEGQAIRFNEARVRSMGRSATGIKGITLEKNDEVIGSVSLKRAATSILVVTDKGFGKRSDVSDYRVTNRGGKGIITIKAGDKNGNMIAIKEALDNDDIILVTTKGIIIRQHIKDIRVMGRNTLGVRLITLGQGDTLSAVATVSSEEDDKEE
jgi:DNA gyrase subunit A